MDQEQERKDDGREHLTFVSYAREDAESVLEVTSSLREQGARLWVDQLDIPAGARWDLEIELALDRCDWFLVFLTNASCQSQNVMDEVSYAIDEGKHILPVRMEECRIPLRLRRFQYRDLTQAGGLETLAQQLGIDTRRPTRNQSVGARQSTIGSGPTAREKTEPAHRIESIRTGKGKAVGSCGELIQAFDRNARPFHVTCPILKSSTVNVSIRDADSTTFPNQRRENYKLIAACRAALEFLKAPQVKVSLEHWSDLHVGKGMGSSTADIIAAARAIGNAFNYEFTESELAKIACSIESSDGERVHAN